MNEIMQSLYDRKSLRVFDENRPVEPEVKQAIISSAAQAPTAGNQQMYTILNITDKAVKEKLSELCDNQSFIAKADLVLVFLADCRRWYDSYIYAGADARKPSESDLLLAVADAVIAAQNTVVAAESFGVGSCYIGDCMENEEQMRELLCLDEFIFPAAMLVYGYPADGQAERRKPQRLDEKYFVFENAYKRLDKNEHEQMYRERARNRPEFDYDKYIKAFCERKYMSDFSAEMRRSAKKYLEHFSN